MPEFFKKYLNRLNQEQTEQLADYLDSVYEAPDEVLEVLHIRCKKNGWVW